MLLQRGVLSSVSPESVLLRLAVLLTCRLRDGRGHAETARVPRV